MSLPHYDARLEPPDPELCEHDEVPDDCEYCVREAYEDDAYDRMIDAKFDPPGS